MEQKGLGTIAWMRTIRIWRPTWECINKDLPAIDRSQEEKGSGGADRLILNLFSFKELRVTKNTAYKMKVKIQIQSEMSYKNSY